MSKSRTVYILLTASKVHVYSSRSRARKVSERCRRAGVSVEFLSADVRARDPFTKTPTPTENALIWAGYRD